MTSSVPAVSVRPLRIGIDFDNTIISYDQVFLEEAKNRGLVAAAFVGSKRAIRDQIRNLPNGELAWQRLQGYVYGVGIKSANELDGVAAFLRRARVAGHQIFVISHKTEYGHYDPTRVNLREAALAWMMARKFFEPDGFGIPRANIFFEADRASKLARIRQSRLDYFIDDLEEVLVDPDFPAEVKRVLLAESGGDINCTLCRDWDRIGQVVFNVHD